MKIKKPSESTPPQVESSEGSFRLLFHHHPLPMWVYDLETLAFLEVNNTAVKNYGYTRKEFLTMSVKDIRPPEEITRLLTHLTKKRSAVQYSGEWRHKLKNGRIIDVEITSHTIQYNGRHAALVVAMDITQRKQAENTLQKSESSLRAVLHSAADGILAVSNENEVLYTNERFVQMWRIPQEIMMSKNDSVLLQHVLDQLRDPQSFLRKVQELYKSEKDSFDTLYFKDGRVFERLSCPLMQETTMQGRVWSFRDITERKRAEEALQESETQYHRLIETMQDGVYRSSHEGKFLEVNPAMVKILGYGSKEELCAIDIKSQLYFTPEDRESAALDEKFQEMAIFRLRKKDGSEIWVEDHGRHIVDDDGKVLFHEGVLRDVTERLRAEEALRESEEKFRTIYNESPIGIELYRADGIQITANKASLDMFGIPDESEIQGFNIFDGTSLDDEKKEKLRRGESVAYQSVLDFEKIKKLKQYKTNKTGKAYFDYIITPLLDAVQKTIHGYLVQVQDITERKRSDLERNVLFEIAHGITTTSNLDELLNLVHFSLKKVLFAENCFIALHDTTTGLFTFPYFVDQFDAPPAPQSLEKSCTAYVFRTCRPMLITQEDFEQLEKQGKVASIGTPAPEWLGVPLRTPSKTIGVLVLQQYEEKKTYTQHDIEFLTSIGNQIAQAIERKQAEESLLKLRKAINTSGDAIFLTDINGTFTFINPTFTAIYGYTADDLIGKFTPRILKGGVLKAEYYKLFWETLTTKREIRAEITNKRKDGTHVLIETLVNPILDEEENIIGYLAIQRDITERKKGEEKRKSLEGQLQQAQKLESLGTLASGIAHDFNNILGIIIGHASLLERLPAERATIQKNVEAITKASMRGAGLVKQMLTFARKTDVLFEPIILNDIVEEMKKLMAETFPKTITLTFQLERNLPFIEADATQVHQVMLNLCVNARDAMPNGGTLAVTTYLESGEVLRGTHSKATAENYIVLSLADTGMGMDEETQRRIFEPFFTTKERGKGSGLGLALVFGIMETHNGFVIVHSGLGKGTTFQCYFPVPQKTEEHAQINEKVIEEIPGGSETILVIEDEEMLRELVKVFLESNGYTVLTAEDGMEGLAVFERQKNTIGLVISDLGLPVFGGDELYRKLTKVNPHVLMILASGYIEPGMKAKLLGEGIKEFIQKPYNPDEVLRAIRRVIDNK
jgi:two-component system cell cycle sensor histidine kinase/response regulator CckA